MSSSQDGADLQGPPAGSAEGARALRRRVRAHAKTRTKVNRAVESALKGQAKKRSKPSGRIVQARGSSKIGPPVKDEALEQIDALMASPLGRTWLTSDVVADGDLKVPGPKQPGVVAPLPRRMFIEGDAPQTIPPRARAVVFRASFLRSFSRLFVWYYGLLTFYTLNMWDALWGRGSTRSRAVRMRQILERLGPTFIKVGQQMALRADILPYEYCEELSKLLDKVPPMKLEHAVAAIERVTGKPLGDTFLVFDPEPIGSASLACVYQAILHDGSKVAVKVRRKGIGPLLAADLRAFDWLLVFSELTGFQRSGSTRNMRVDLKTMLMDELNFHQEGRYTELFRRRARGQRAFTAPRVYFQLSGEDVLVTEFVGGVFLREILSALDRSDDKAITALRERGINPTKIAQYLTLAFNWEALESVLFHADPHPANIVVRPDNTLVFIDFGACGRFSSKYKRLWMQFYKHFAREDVDGMVETTIAMMEPLPPIDLDSFGKELEGIYWDWLYAMQSKHAEWWERASGVMWMKMIEIGRRYTVPMNLDTLRAFRATFLYDTIIYRLDKNLNLEKENSRYFDAVGRRARKRVRKAVSSRVQDGLHPVDYLAIEEALRMVGQIGSRMQHFLDTPRHNYAAIVDKAAFTFSVVLRLTFFYFTLHLIVIASQYVYYWSNNARDYVVLGPLKLLDKYPAAHIIPVVILLVSIRKLLMRTADVEQQR